MEILPQELQNTIMFYALEHPTAKMIKDEYNGDYRHYFHFSLDWSVGRCYICDKNCCKVYETDLGADSSMIKVCNFCSNMEDTPHHLIYGDNDEDNDEESDDEDIDDEDSGDED